jgi:phosphate transport system permease protein
MKFDRHGRRKIFSHSMTVLSGLAVVVILVPLVAVIYEAVVQGGAAFSVTFFTQRPANPCVAHPGIACPLGGVYTPIEGTLELIGLASLVAVPIGIGAAVFTVEYGRNRAIARVISTTADVLSGVPSILAGIFAFTLFLQFDKAIVNSTLDGSLALAVLMIPIVTRTCEEALRTVPESVREAALALGISRWKISVRIVLAAALPGVVTGVLLSVARAAGEAAPLLFTVGNGCLHPLQGINQQGCALPLWIYWGATSATTNWTTLAWGAALLLILMVLAISVTSRLVLNRWVRRTQGG